MITRKLEEVVMVFKEWNLMEEGGIDGLLM